MVAEERCSGLLRFALSSHVEVRALQAVGPCRGPAQQPAPVREHRGDWDGVKRLMHLLNVPHPEWQPWCSSPPKTLLTKPVGVMSPFCSIPEAAPGQQRPPELPLCHPQRAPNGTGGAGVGHRLCHITRTHAEPPLPQTASCPALPHAVRRSVPKRCGAVAPSLLVCPCRQALPLIRGGILA